MTLYAIRPDPITGSLDEAEVVEQSKYGWDFLEQAITLWRLVDANRAAAIEVTLDRVAKDAGDGELCIEARDLNELVRLLTGVEDAIVAAGIIDSEWRVPVERLQDVAKRVPAMDLATERTLHNKTNALAEVIMNAISIKHFLSNAIKAGCVVVVG
jgi:ATP phosphoribosyltransferase